ncbi:GNAT family N-acetyltransferase [Streptomyces sp. NBC_01190]|uniref:GNAT family N-acetyltransferase n=1 Tax=Streptomyces sp. NBC_01190 TaxID=2903767 RepID=UPI00386FBC37|nr:GNAT family N-acetyltransferase [Streptomyces sp. NBC_01190]
MFMRRDGMVIARVAEGVHWHALDDDEVVGRGYALHRPDGRVFLSVDSWQDDVFHRLADAMLADLPAPVYTVVDDDDREVLARWQGVGFVPHRREREYVVPTDPATTGLDRPPPPGVTVLPVGQAAEAPLRALDQALRDEVGPVGWQSMPAEVLVRPDGSGGVFDPSRYAVAVRDGRYVGLARVAPLPRRPRLGLLAVRTDHRRLGIARAMLTEVLGSLHRSGIAELSTEVDEDNAPALALFESAGARHLRDAVELLHT